MKGAASAGSTLVRKVRQNWRWGLTHGWADLIEEHDLDPSVRGRRALRKVRWHLTARRAHVDPTAVFLHGAQRSGTNMIVHGLAEAPEFRVYNEGNSAAFDNFRLRPLSTIEGLIAASQAEFVLFKPLCDSHRAAELLDRFHPRTRAIWAYRDVDGRVRSALAKFGDSNLRVLRAFADGEADDAWQVQGMSAANANFVRSFDLDRVSAGSAAALFWYVRNSLYFEMSLDERQDAMLVSYNRFLAEPDANARALCAFLGVGYRPQLITHVKPRPPAWPEVLSIEDRIRERCADLQERLDRASANQVSTLLHR
jgi:hypothetical protein